MTENAQSTYEHEEQDEEIVDAVPVLVEIRERAPVVVPAPPSTAQTAVVAVGSFVAGAATAAVVAHQLGKLAGKTVKLPGSPRRAAARQEPLEVLDRRTFLIDVHVLGRRSAEPRLDVERRVEIEPRWPVRLPGAGMDGVMRRRGRVLERLLHVDGRAVVVRAAQPQPDRVVIGAWGPDDVACDRALERMRFAFGVDEDLGDFHRAFRDDPLIGTLVRRRPWLRPRRRPEPFEALAWAVCEQLIEYVRAAEIERRIVRRLGRRCLETGLRDVPDAVAVAGCAPALLQSFDLGGSRALTLVRAAREIARGRIDLHGDHERSWMKLRAIAGIGSWTVEILALQGQGRFDQVPAGDLGLLKWAGRLLSGGDPKAVASEAEVRELLAPYAPWGGLAACYLLGA